jgi:hypothetical protein
MPVKNDSKTYKPLTKPPKDGEIGPGSKFECSLNLKLVIKS